MTPPAVSTFLWFDTEAEPAATLYCGLIKDARILSVLRRGEAAFFVDFEMAGQRFAAMNGGPHYRLTPAASIVIHLDSQAEVDRIWDALLAGGGQESRCGWLVDRFGLSWQIIPRALPRLLAADQTGRVMQAMLGMIKIDVAALEAVALEAAALEAAAL